MLVAAGFAAALAGCSSDESPAAAGRRELGLETVAAGTPIELMLLSPAESGKSKPGETLRFAVAYGVMGSTGNVAIPPGTIVTAQVVNSRAAGALSAVLNEPARLEIEFESLDRGGVAVPLAPEPGESGKPYALTRENTGLPAPDEAVKKQIEREAMRRLLEELSAAIEEGKDPGKLDEELAEDPEFQRLLEAAGMPSVRRLLDDHSSRREGIRRLLTIAEDLRRGRVRFLDAEQAHISLAAIEEIGRLAGQVTGTLKGVFKGRNIRAHVGTRVRVYVAQDADVPAVGRLRMPR